MKAFLWMGVIFVLVMVGMKACKGGMDSIKSPFGSSPKPAASAGKVGVPDKSGPVAPALSGPGYVMHVERFRGWVGGLGQLRTDAGQYKVGALCLHGLVERVSERQAAIRGPAGLVVVVAVDDYTRPEPVEEPEKEKALNFLANEPAEKPLTLASSVPVKTVSGVAPPMADVPVEQSLKLTRQQKRQAARGVVVKGPFVSGVKMGP